MCVTNMMGRAAGEGVDTDMTTGVRGVGPVPMALAHSGVCMFYAAGSGGADGSEVGV